MIVTFFILNALYYFLFSWSFEVERFEPIEKTTALKRIDIASAIISMALVMVSVYIMEQPNALLFFAFTLIHAYNTFREWKLNRPSREYIRSLSLCIFSTAYTVTAFVVYH
ncbi:DUF4181 domain-containing protein [Paenibacillus sp. TCA20]|uniref:DUF4181 domain-containing protein n=1 Tax=Paenibacillus sp. TCA20 TaxID=1499968 RepID=UPI00064C4B9B